MRTSSIRILACVLALGTMAPSFAQVAKPTGQADVKKTEVKKAKKKLRYRLQPPPKNFSPPVFSCDSTVFDWGSVTQGEVVTHSFLVKNTGSQPLKIERVKPACGCTTVNFDKVIGAGSTGRVILKVNTKKFTGKIKKTASVFSNAGRDAHRLTMQGEIETPLTFEPKVARIDYVRGTTPEPLVVTVRRTTKKAVTFKGVSVDPKKKDLLQAELNEVEKDNVYKVRLVPTVPVSATKYHSVEVNLSTVMEGKPIDVPLRVSIRVRDRIEASPASIYFTRRDTEKVGKPNAAPVTRSVTLKSLDPNHKFKITGVKVLGTTFEAKIDTVKDGSEYKLTATLPALPKGNTRRVSEKIVVTTDDQLVPEITLSATASFGRAGAPTTRPGGFRPGVKPTPTPRVTQPKK